MRRLASFRARVGLIALAGVALRLGYVLGPARDTKGIGDWYFFHWGANLIADGHWFVEPFEKVFHGRLEPSAGDASADAGTGGEADERGGAAAPAPALTPTPVTS